MDSDISIVESSKEKYSNYEVNFTDTSDLSEDVISARNRGKFGRFIDTFKPAATVDIDTTGLTEEEAYHLRMSSAPMSPELSPLQMFAIAVGGSIGSGLFLGSGNDLAAGGPGGVIIGFFITGVLLFFMMQSLGEVAVRFPVQGSFSIHTMRLVDDSWGFAMSWNYVLQWIVCFPLELTAAAIILGYWKSDDNGATNVNPAAWVSLFWFVLSLISFGGAGIWGTAETVLSVIKIITVVGMCIFGIICTAGGGPTHHYFGTHFWYDPGAFNNGVKGTVNVFVNSAFAMSGIEMIALASAESKDPHKVLPKAVKQTFWRILLFYLVSLTIIFCLVPYTDPRLGTSSDGKASPFVLACVNAGVSGLPSVINVVILLAALSVGNAAVFASSRTLAAVANAGGAPKFVGYIDRNGRPLVGIAITVIFGLIGFIVASPAYNPAFIWMQAIAGQSSLFTWGSINLNHIMMRIAMKKQGRSLKEQYYSTPFGIWGSCISLAIVLAILGLEVWVALFPIGESPSAEAFFEVWLSLPIVLAFYIGHKLYYRKPFVYPSTVDLVTGARIKTEEEMNATDEDQVVLRQLPKWRRYPLQVYHAWC
ncbi:Dip5 protein [Starmerella bacillaris]|uniref:Dip5 protein n=1 Tax=Starmerella bacillaris TaxID=1247836 RepID=A0AAV5RPD5_STABA|nr:Dip5 protein [Starmerella bacillaris]